MNTILFWMIVIAVLFMLGKYSDTIKDWLARLVSRAGIVDSQQSMQDDIELNSPQKLSGGDENSSIPDSLGAKLMDFAEASKETLRRTLNKAATTV